MSATVYTPLLMESYEKGVQDIETSMEDIYAITHDLASLVYTQRDVLDHIESNIMRADERTSNGTMELSKASVHQKHARSKAVCLFIVAAVVATILIIVLVETLK